MGKFLELELKNVWLGIQVKAMHFMKKAKAYWAQDCPKGRALEILFEGEAEIVEIFAEIKK